MLRPSISLTHGTLASRVVSLPQPNDPHAIDGYDLSHRIGVHAEGPICSACVGHLIHPNNGSHTPLFEPCFLGLRAREERHHLLRRCDCEDRSEIKTALAPVFALLVV